MELKFEWNEKKNIKNQKKHKISFEEARLVFYDPMRKEKFDKKHSLFEGRWIMLGLIGQTILKVSFTEKKDCIRIISARKADKDDKEEYYYGYCKINS